MDIVEAVKVAKELATTGVVNINDIGMPFYSKGFVSSKPKVKPSKFLVSLVKNI